MRIPLHTAAWTLMVVLAGCASLGLVTPKSFDERLAAAYTANTAVRDAAANSFEGGALKTEDASYALEQTRDNRKLLDATRSLANQGDLATAEGRLTLVVTSLTALRAYLQSQGVKVESP